MNIALRVLTGPLKDKVFPLVKPISIGRNGDISLEDPTVSGIHARIEKTETGWMILDNGSKNGVKIGSSKVESAPLKPGVVFYISENAFEVFDQAKAAVRAGTVVMPTPKKEKERPKEAAPARPQAAKSAPVKPVVQEAAPAPKPKPKPKPEKKKKYWHEALIDFLKTHKDAFKDRTIPLVPLEPAVILEFVRGVQMNSKWVLGYGPRKLGPGTIDLPIWEPGAPKICFEIQPTPEGILFKTEHPNLVKLNNQQVDSRLLRMGDTISIHETLIEVDFTE